MKTSKNEVTLRGRIGKKLKVTPFATDKSVVRTSLVTDDGYKKDGEWIEDTQWHNLVFWGIQASFAELNLKKGMLIEIKGKLKNSSFQDEITGATRSITEVVVENAWEVNGARSH